MKRTKAQPSRSRRGGFPCPLCDATHTRVTRTDTVESKLQRRRRRCPSGHEFTTVETIEAEDGRISAPEAAWVRELVDSVVSALKSDPLFHPSGRTMSGEGEAT